MTDGQKRQILLGQITGAHGIRGDVVIRTFTGEPDAIGAYGPLSDAAGSKSFRLKVLRVTAKGVVARIDGVNDRNGAEALRGQELYVARDRLPKTADGEFYHADLIGLEAVAPGGTPLGKIVGLQNFGAGDLLEIKIGDTRATEFVPFTNACVPEIDLAAGRAIVIIPVLAGDDEVDQEPDETASD